MRRTGSPLFLLVAVLGCGAGGTTGRSADASGGPDSEAEASGGEQPDGIDSTDGVAVDAAGVDAADVDAADAATADAADRGPVDDASGDADAGQPRDAAPTDAPVERTSDAGDAGPPVAGCPGVFCEDFETGRIDPAIWNIQVNGGQPMPAVVNQAAMVAHGRYAARFHVNPNVVSYDFIITKAAPAELRGHHFGRAYFMVTPMPPTNHTEYLFAGTTGFPEYRYLEVASAAPLSWQLTYVDLMPPTTGEDYHSGGTVPTGRWLCLEWEFEDVPDRAAVYVDGVLAFSQSKFTFGGASTGLVGGFAAFGFGFYAWHPASYAFDVLYDDIVLDTKRVGCLD